MVTAHVFFDKGGVFSNKAIDFIEKIEPNQHYYYFQANNEIENSTLNTIKSNEELLKLVQQKRIVKVIFHSLHYYQFNLIKKLKKITDNNVRIAWVFWSFEFYQLPFNLIHLYSQSNKKFLYRKLLSVLYEYVFNLVVKKNIKPLSILKPFYFKNIKLIDEFYSFVEDDFFKIFGMKASLSHHFLPYLDISDISITKEQKLKKDKIMIGHSGAPLLNHIEVCKLIKKFSVKTECLIPIVYGNKKYIKELKTSINNNFAINSIFLEDRLPLDKYYNTLSSISIFFLNSYCQQGLGNIVFFLNNNTAIYLSEKTSTFNFLKRKGFIVFSIEQIQKKEDIRRLNINESNINKILINQLLDPNHVSNQWRTLLS